MTDTRYFLRGELDIARSDALRSALAPFVEKGVDLMIDCRQLSFLDSSGVAVLCDTREALEATGHHMLLTNVHGAPLRVLEVMHLTDLLSFERDALSS